MPTLFRQEISIEINGIANLMQLASILFFSALSNCADDYKYDCFWFHGHEKSSEHSAQTTRSLPAYKTKQAQHCQGL
jgi:hypothetical protein